MEARRVFAEILYNGKDISAFVTDFSYTDNSDQTDDVSVTLSDREDRWINEFFPKTGDVISCKIKVTNWEKFGDNREFSFGKFEVDNVNFDDVVTINAISVPITGNGRSEKKNKAWKKITLKNISTDLAKNLGLKLVYDTDINPLYDKMDQNNQSDLEFLEGLCKSDGLCMKITDGQLIIFEELKYDQQPSIGKIIRGESLLIGRPKFSRNAKNIYTGCEIAYFDSKTDKTYKGVFYAPKVGNVGHVLKLNENFNSEKDDMNLNRKAKARLREQNKKEWTVSFSLVGEIIFFAGTNLDFQGWYEFDGKYHVETVTHSISGGGYTLDVNARRCLEGY